jgi:membrane protein YqaA with SNARE-associated domain
MKQGVNSFQDWCLQMTSSKNDMYMLFILAFADASFLPLPITTFFLVLALLNSHKAYKYALFMTLGTFAGAATGYAIGHFAWMNSHGEFTALAHFLFKNVPGFSVELYYKIDVLYARYGFWILALSASTPIPYGVFSISSGVFSINIFVFCLATLISQGIKFYLLALVTKKTGPALKKIVDFIWKPLAIITMLGVIIVIILAL